MSRISIILGVVGFSLVMAFGGSVKYGGKTYKTVKIGEQVWMAENLNYNAEGSKCYDNKPENCVKYGRLYNWATAMKLELSCNSNTCSDKVQLKHQGRCPSGWHIPNSIEWDKLFHYADGTKGAESPYDSPTAGKYLKSITNWTNCGISGSSSSYVCEDAYGFSALPGGYSTPDDSFNLIGSYGGWWTANEISSDLTYFRGMGYFGERAYQLNGIKIYLFSVRCVKD